MTATLLLAGFLLFAPGIAHAQVTVEKIVGTWTGTIEYASSRTGSGGTIPQSLLLRADEIIQ